jgi:hypothetical protein
MRLLLCAWAFFCSSTLLASDWELETKKDGVEVYLKEFAGAEGAKSFKSVSTFDADYQKVVETIGNPEKMAKVIHLVESSEVKRPDLNDYALYLVIDMPWPVTNRDLVWTVKKVSESLEKTVFDLGLQNDLAKANDDYVRFKKVNGTFTVENSGPNKTLVTWEQFNDLGGSIPTMILNSAANDVGFESLKNLRAVAVPAK